MRVAVVVGHHRSAQGAKSVDGTREWTWCGSMAAYLTAALMDVGAFPSVFIRQELPYKTAMAELTGRVNRWNPDLVVALHYNAAPEGHKGKFHGTECLFFPGSHRGEEWAERLSEAIAVVQGTRNRGAKAQGESWSGVPLYILRDVRAPAVLIEFGFGDHAEDWRKMNAAKDSGATGRAIAAILATPET